MQVSFPRRAGQLATTRAAVGSTRTRPQISDLGTILAAQVVEFDGSGRALDQHHRVTPAAASGCAKRGRDDLS